jgi:hypothetical protein
MGRTLGTGGMFRGKTVAGPSQFEAPYGNSLVGAYAMVARRHMHEFGTTSEQLAEIAVGVREYAGLNPHALYRDPITVSDVIGSRLVADPLHKLDCCVISDGGGAVIMTTAERARDLRQPGVAVLGAAGGMTHWNISQMGDYTTSAAAVCAPEAFARAGLRPSDVDTIQFYDSFTITVLVLLEDAGFCKKGEGGAFVAEGHLRRGGRLPLNTDGGGLSSCHPGMRGIFLLIESVRDSCAVRAASRRCPMPRLRSRSARAAGSRASAPSCWERRSASHGRGAWRRVEEAAARARPRVRAVLGGRRGRSPALPGVSRVRTPPVLPAAAVHRVRRRSRVGRGVGTRHRAHLHRRATVRRAAVQGRAALRRWR